MRVSGLSVPEVVREIITQNRSIYDCMKMDLVNYTALAVKIQPEIEKMLGNSVNLNTIVVAIKRYADSFETKQKVEKEPVLKNARLALSDGIVDIKFSAKDLDEIDPAVILGQFSKITNNYEFFRSSDSFRFLTEDIDEIRQMFEHYPNRESMFSSGLAKIKITIPPNQNRSDAISYVAEVLHFEGIEILNAYFSQDSIIVVLDEMNASKAYDILRSNIAKTK